MAPFRPDQDIPSLAGKVILITGGTSGLGAGSVQELAKHDPAHIFFTGRDQAKATALITQVRQKHPNAQIDFIRCDVSSLASVREAAATFTAKADRLDILMLNAGIMAVDPKLSKDGYEIQFATNHLGHAALVRSLLPILTKTADAGGDVRVINMTSIAHAQAPKKGVEFDTLKTTQDGLGGLIPGGKWSRYGQSKLAQLLYSQELAKHYPKLTSVSVHPGVINTGLFDNVDFWHRVPLMFTKRTPVAEGHYNQCWAATCSKSALKNGEYYEPLGVLGNRQNTQARDPKLAKKLWDWTEQELSKA